MTVLLAVLAALVVGGLVWLVLRRERLDDGQRFSKAREITSSWANGSQPYAFRGHDAPHDGPEQAGQD
jgi:hypothetical protein